MTNIPLMVVIELTSQIVKIFIARLVEFKSMTLKVT
jgi:hypothetical protein